MYGQAPFSQSFVWRIFQNERKIYKHFIGIINIRICHFVTIKPLCLFYMVYLKKWLLYMLYFNIILFKPQWFIYRKKYIFHKAVYIEWMHIHTS